MEHLLGDIAFVLALQVAAPVHREFKLIFMLFQDLNGFGIGDVGEFLRLGQSSQPGQQPFVHKGVEKLHLLRAVLQHMADDVFRHIFGQGHVVFQVGKGDLRFDHPKLRRMAAGVGVFRAERGAKGIGLAKGQGKRLRFQLARHRQVRGGAEEILAVVHLSIRCFGHVV